jgi:hypothetical protein
MCGENNNSSEITASGRRPSVQGRKGRGSDKSSNRGNIIFTSYGHGSSGGNNGNNDDGCGGGGAFSTNRGSTSQCGGIDSGSGDGGIGGNSGGRQTGRTTFNSNASGRRQRGGISTGGEGGNS